MSTFIKNFKTRRDLVPKWITNTLVITAFLLPFLLIPGEDNLFDYILNFIKSITGPEESFIHALAYFLCVLTLLIPTAIIIQIIGQLIILRGYNSN